MGKSLQLPYANVTKLSKTVGLVHKKCVDPSSSISAILASSSSRLPVSYISASSSFSFIEHLLVANGHARKATYAIQHRCMSLKVDVSRTKLIYVIFEFVLLRIMIYLTKHRCIHVRNFVRKKPHNS